eukprot:4361834-Alexandrium_andersonii.AAC.1
MVEVVWFGDRCALAWSLCCVFTVCAAWLAVCSACVCSACAGGKLNMRRSSNAQVLVCLLLAGGSWLLAVLAADGRCANAECESPVPVAWVLVAVTSNMQ